MTTDLFIFLIGILMGIVGAAINNLGIVLQKRQVNIKAPPESEEKTVTDIVDFLKDKIWILGILMQTIFYLPFLLISFDVLGVTLAQPLSISGLIFLVLGLVIMLNEEIRKLEGVGIILMISGVFTVTFGGVVGEITLDILINSLQNFWLILLLIAGLSIVSLILIWKIKKIRMSVLGFLSGLCYAFVSISLQLLTLSLTELQRGSLPFLIFGIAGAIVGTVFGILAAQEAFKRGQAINIIPFSQISMNLIPILAGLVVFQQIILNPIFFWIGTASIIVSATLLARFQ